MAHTHFHDAVRWHAIDALRVGEGVKEQAVFIERLLMMDALSGETVIDLPVDRGFRERFGNPYAVTYDSKRQEILVPN